MCVNCDFIKMASESKHPDDVLSFMLQHRLGASDSTPRKILDMYPTATRQELEDAWAPLQEEWDKRHPPKQRETLKVPLKLKPFPISIHYDMLLQKVRAALPPELHGTLEELLRTPRSGANGITPYFPTPYTLNILGTDVEVGSPDAEWVAANFFQVRAFTVALTFIHQLLGKLGITPDTLIMEQVVLDDPTDSESAEKIEIAQRMGQVVEAICWASAAMRLGYSRVGWLKLWADLNGPLETFRSMLTFAHEHDERLVELTTTAMKHLVVSEFDKFPKDHKFLQLLGIKEELIQAIQQAKQDGLGISIPKHLAAEVLSNFEELLRKHEGDLPAALKEMLDKYPGTKLLTHEDLEEINAAEGEWHTLKDVLKRILGQLKSKTEKE